jgi:hypothetical protein
MGHDEGSTRRKVAELVTKAGQFYPLSRPNASFFLKGEVMPFAKKDRRARMR